jgi:hypothetical protein
LSLLAAIDVDPQQPLVAEGGNDLLGELDPAILCVRVEEAGGDATQRTKLSRPAAATAMKATRYWSASIVRSWGGSTSHDPLGLVAGSNNIDVGSSCGIRDRRHRAGRHHALRQEGRA